MADDTFPVEEKLKFHPADSPRGTLFYNLEELTKEQQIQLNALKIKKIRDDEKYLAEHPEIRAIIVLLLRVLFKHRPMIKIHEFIAKFFNRSESDIADDVEDYIEARKDHVYEDVSAVDITKNKKNGKIEKEESIEEKPLDFICAESCVCDHAMEWKMPYHPHDQLEMKKLLSTALILGFFTACVVGFGGSEDKFIKKYAMMKIYESCFGSEVVKQIRKEMKAACAKCASYDMPPMVPPTERPSPTSAPPQEMAHENSNALYPQQPFDQEKLNQAILAYRPNPFGAPQYRPYSPVSGFYPFNNPMYQPMFYPPYQQAQAQFSPYSFPMVGQYLGGNRMSRDLDVRSQLEALTSRMSGRVKNVTCVMQELGYLDDNLEPNYLKISERINNLPVSEELRRDMLDGIQFCQQFSQCVPEIKKERAPLSRELIRPMFFFKCYKHKKLEACVMKDVREKYAGVGEEDLDDDVEIRRQGKDLKFEKDRDMDSLATDIYEFLYGSDASLDLDNLL